MGRREAVKVLPVQAYFASGGGGAHVVIEGRLVARVWEVIGRGGGGGGFGVGGREGFEKVLRFGVLDQTYRDPPRVEIEELSG